jgi:hypothetical protein
MGRSIQENGMMEKHMVMESKLYPMAQYMMVSGKRVSLR